MKQNLLSRWQANFLTGLAIVLPGVVSVAALFWHELTRVDDD